MNTNRRTGLAIGAATALVLASVTALLPAGAANPDVTITSGSGDVPITQVVLDDNGSTVTQNTEATRTPGVGRVTDSDDDPVSFLSVTVNDGGPVVLDEFNVGTVTVTNFDFPAGSSGVYAFENGTQTQVGTAGFEAAVAQTVNSLDLRDYMGFDSVSAAASAPASNFDILFDAPLRNSDYLLVSERDGNTFFDLVALDKQGNVIDGSNKVGFDSTYGWNTGYAPSNQAGQPMFFTVVDIAGFGVVTEDEPIYGFRIDNDGEADVKFFGLSADPFLPAMTLEKTVYTGHDVGVSCGASSEVVNVANGADITFCFSITNNGEADLDNLTITDADLGLAGVDADDAGTFTVVSGDLPLIEGETMVIAYDTAAAGPVINTATATADVLLSTGGINTILSPETDTDTAQVIAPALASISGSVVDNNSDPIEGVTITLSGPASDTATTLADGSYSFTGLAPGTYAVTETQPTKYDDGAESVGTIGGTPTGDASINDVISAIVLASGEDSIDNDFAEAIRPGTISGTVVDNNNDPIPGVAIALSGTATDAALTGSDGTYSFTNLQPGTYAVTETQPTGFGDGGEDAGTIDGTITGDDAVDDVISAIVLGSGDDSINNDFDEVVIVPGAISGTVVDQDGDPIAGVTVALSGTATDSTTTGADGTYSFTGLAPGTYTVTETTPTGYTDGGETAGSLGGTVTDDVIADIPLAAGEGSVGNDFDENVIPDPASISGTVVDDLGRPIPGVTVTLGGDVTATTVTDADGNYSFAGLPAGTYTVNEAQPAGYGDGVDTAGSAGGTVTNDLISEITLAAGENSLDNDFAETTASVAGTVVDGAGVGIAGVTITLAGTNDGGQPVSVTTTTDANGDYLFDGLLSGIYTITESQPAGYGDGADTAGSTGGTVTNDVISEISLGAGIASIDNDFAELLQVVTPALPDTGSETGLTVAYGLLLLVMGAIFMLSANQLSRRRTI